MRIVRRETERTVDPRLQLLREHVLEAVGFGMDVVDVDAQRLGEIELEQPVMADHLDGYALARRREPDALVGSVVHELECCELLHHLAG